MNNSVEQQIKHFNQVAESYYKERQNPRLQFLKDVLWRAAFKSSKSWGLISPLKVLDAMCGFGDAYEILSKNLVCPFEYEAFDYSEKMVAYATNNHKGSHIFKQDILTLEMKETYDLIILIGGLHHVYENAPLAVQNITRALKKGGIFINFEPTHNNPLTRKIRDKVYDCNDLFEKNTEQAFHVKELRLLFESNGLSIRDTLYPGLLAYVLWYNPDAFPILNRGPLMIVKMVTSVEKFLWRSRLAYYLSFATLTVCEKNEHT